MSCPDPDSEASPDAEAPEVSIAKTLRDNAAERPNAHRETGRTTHGEDKLRTELAESTVHRNNIEFGIADLLPELCIA